MKKSIILLFVVVTLCGCNQNTNKMVGKWHDRHPISENYLLREDGTGRTNPEEGFSREFTWKMSGDTLQMFFDDDRRNYYLVKEFGQKKFSEIYRDAADDGTSYKTVRLVELNEDNGQWVESEYDEVWNDYAAEEHLMQKFFGNGH